MEDDKTLSQTRRNGGDATNPTSSEVVQVVGASQQQQRNNRNAKEREDLLVAKSRAVYDPVKAEAVFWAQPTRWLFRNAQIFVPLAFFVARVVTDVLTDKEEAQREVRARELTEIISKLGPAIIKAGQALASRPDLLPAEYLKELQKLQDRVPPFETERALRRVEASLNLNRFDDVFELLEDTPVAAASIGQVYRARLVKKGKKKKTSGRLIVRSGEEDSDDDDDVVVALKVQRPDCEEIIALDLFILRWWAKRWTDVFSAIGRDIDLVSVIDDFGRIIYREIDYVAEASNAKKFRELYADFVDAHLVKVPEIYEDLTTNEVLTMEWVDGARLVDGEKLKAATGDAEAPARLVDTLVQCSLKQMLDLGYFHADPHAGNLLATPDGRLCYLDFGMMSYLDPNQRLSIIEAVVHLVNRDFDALADLYVRMGFIKRDVDVAPIVDGLASALPDVLDASVAELNVKNVVSKLGDVMYTFPFTLPPFYVAIIRCLGVLEGVAIQVDPDFRIVSDAYPYIASRLLTDDAPELKTALRRLLFKDDVPQWTRFEALLERASTSADYDAVRVVDVMVDLVASDAASKARQALVRDVVDALDHLGVENARRLLKLAFGVDLPPPPPFLAAFGGGSSSAGVGGSGALPFSAPSLTKKTSGTTSRLAPAASRADDDDDDDDVVVKTSASSIYPSSSSLSSDAPPATTTLLKAAHVLQERSTAALGSLDSASAAVDNLRTYVPLARRAATEPALRRMAAEITAAVAERAASRAIRLALLPLSGPNALTSS